MASSEAQKFITLMRSNTSVFSLVTSDFEGIIYSKTRHGNRKKAIAVVWVGDTGHLGCGDGRRQKSK